MAAQHKTVDDNREKTLHRATLLAATLAATTAHAETAVTLDAGHQDEAYTLHHWQTGTDYQYRVNAGHERTVTVPHETGTVLVNDDEGRRLRQVEAGTDEQAPTRYAALADVPEAPNLSPLRTERRANDAQLTTAGHERAATRRNVADLTTSHYNLSERVANIDSAVNRTQDALTATAALSQHNPGSGLNVSLAGAEWRSRQGLSVAVSYRGEAGSAQIGAARSGDETVIGGSVSWRLY